MITVVDYGMGNLRSVEKALERVAGCVRVTDDPAAVKSASIVVLPGVGAFDHAVMELKRRKLWELVLAHLRANKPYLGICLGLQLLFERSAEGREEGFGVLKGKVLRFPSWMRVPHMGWNAVDMNVPLLGPAFKPFNHKHFYFVHSFYAVPKDASCIAGKTQAGVEFASMVRSGNILATQFHLEKSQANGLGLLKTCLESFKR